MVYLLSVVEEIVGQIVANVAKDATTKHSGSHVPVPGENGVCEIPEGSGQDNEESWRHHKAVLVHREIVMNSVEQEVQSKTNAVVGQFLIEVEQTAVEAVLNESPEA